MLDARLMTMRIALVVLTTAAMAVSSGCTDTRDSSSRQTAESLAGQSVPVEPESRTLTRAGLTVSLPRDCRVARAGTTEKAPKTFDCAGLRRLKLARVSPVEDLIRPGIYRSRGGWVGLRVVDSSYVYAIANEREVLRGVLASAQTTSP